jgi:integrase
VGVPISARRTELGSAAGGWVREPRGGAKGTPEALDRVGPGRGGATTLAEFVEEYLELHQAEPVTIAKLRWLLGKATDTLGEKRVADLSLKDVYAWHLTVPEGHRFEATQALRQVFNRAVAWGMLDFNPAKRGVPNTQRRPKEKRPFESWAQIEAIAARLGTVYGPMLIFGAATGLRPSELFGLEQHDADRELGVVYVRRGFANGRIKNTKTRLSTRAVPLQAKAVEALDRLPASVNPILFQNARGCRIDFRVFGRRHWRPAQIADGIEPIRGLYDLRHTYATFRAPRRCSGVRRLALRRLEHRDDRPPLRPPGPRQSRARSRAPRRSSRSNGRRTLRGRRTEPAQTRSATAIRSLIEDGLTGAWTLGGRRGSSPSLPPTTKGADQQELPEAL